AAELLRHWPYIAAGTVGVVLGTLIGKPILAKISERIFQKVVSAAILLLGFWMLARAFLPE
ncbi:MAG TPA: hypothetical protein VN878_07720, partial [Usitatibacter sp.]|nr:hypothetical protein [Usitatibacter sp.]